MQFYLQVHKVKSIVECVSARSLFWVQVHDMPLIYMNRGVGTKIGESFGTLEDLDMAGDGGGWGRYLCMHVNIDLHRALKRGRMLSMGNGVLGKI